jgi:deoxyribonuclease-1-like protein
MAYLFVGDRMGKRKTIGLILIVIAAAVTAASSYVALLPNSIGEATTVRIASFNIQIFGRNKRQNEDVMMVLVRIVREFDLVLVQEIRDSSEQTAPIFLQRINEIEGPKYEFIRSERLGRTTSKEAYAYFYNTETIEFIPSSDYVYNDVGDLFEREPYVASFQSGNFDFVLVGIHTKPDDAYSEIGNLTSVISSIKEAIPNEKDIIVLGDFNADGIYFDENESSNPLRSPEFHWLITNEMDTMTKTDYTYDRIVILNSTLNHEYVARSASVFYFDKTYGIDNVTLVTEVSDHYPVFAEFTTNIVDDD